MTLRMRSVEYEPGLKRSSAQNPVLLMHMHYFHVIFRSTYLNALAK